MELYYFNLISFSLLLFIFVLLKVKGELYFRFFEREKNDKVISYILI